MNQIAVRYLGQPVGRLAETSAGLAFEYDPVFIATGHELSPFNLPLRPGVQIGHRGQLPGLFQDSLPDAWGRRIMGAWLNQNRASLPPPTQLTLLAYIGDRGMGALTFAPALATDAGEKEAVSLAKIHGAATVAAKGGRVNLRALADVASFAGGARPKALLGLPRSRSGEPLAGAGELPDSHEAWLVKFDLSRDGTAGPLEEAYALMARAAGIDLPETNLLETRQRKIIRRHFAVKRFDRERTLRSHHHTLAALCQMDSGDLDYETYLRVTRRLTQDEAEVWRAFRRAVFNVLAHNRDDHGKNHGFIYRDRQWTLGPAYDLTFVSPVDQPMRGMSVAGDRWTTAQPHLVRLAESEGLDRRIAAGVIEEVRSAIARWREFADQAQVPSLKAAEVGQVLTSAPRPRLVPSVW